MPGGDLGVNTSGFWRVMIFGILLFICVALLPGVGKIPAPVPTPIVFTQPTSISTSTTPETSSVAAAIGPVVNITNTDPKVQRAIVHVLESKQTANANQSFLSSPDCASGQHISVWAPGYYILTFPCVDNPAARYDVQMEKFDQSDNPNYAWMGASSNFNQPYNCQICHSGTLSNLLNEFPEWAMDGHSKVFVDPYFWTTYLGTNINRQPSQQIQWSILGNGQKIYPVIDPMKANYDAGYRLDYPVNNGNCVFCHAPASFAGTLQEMDLTTLINSSPGKHVSAAIEGVTCDVCHKVTDVLVDKNSKLPYDDRPGILSMSIVRPASTQQFSYGPLAYQSIVSNDSKNACFSVFSESKFCASCHYGKFANTQIYGSYKEWLDSTYSKPENPGFRSCQDCHMLNETQIANTLPKERAACSEANMSFSNFDHNMMKYGSDPENPSRQIPLLVKNAAQIKLEPVLSEGQISIKVTVQSVGVGHKFPTDSPLRHLILLIEAIDGRGNPLTQSAGSMIPAWAAPDYGGRPGQIYANILKDKDTNLAPSFAYWNPVESAWQGADTRLVPGMPVQSTYSFAAPYDGTAMIIARLIYRRAFKNIVDKKGWPLSDLDVKVTEVAIECTGFGTVPATMQCQAVSP